MITCSRKDCEIHLYLLVECEGYLGWSLPLITRFTYNLHLSPKLTQILLRYEGSNNSPLKLGDQSPLEPHR